MDRRVCASDRIGGHKMICRRTPQPLWLQNLEPNLRIDSLQFTILRMSAHYHIGLSHIVVLNRHLVANSITHWNLCYIYTIKLLVITPFITV